MSLNILSEAKITGAVLKGRPAEVLLVILLVTGCGQGEVTPTDADSPTVTSPASPAAGSPSPTVASTPSPTPKGQSKAASALIEPDTVAGKVILGSTKSEVFEVLGMSNSSGQETDLSGERYDFERWNLGPGNTGLTLNFRTPSVTSPRLTDWVATARGPSTSKGIQVGDPASKVVEAYGPLQEFCCDSRIISVERGGGRMIILVGNDTQKVDRIVGGDEEFWSRSIAD